jgi:hypothetical protein
MQLTRDFQRVAAQIPLQAIQFAPEELAALSQSQLGMPTQQPQSLTQPETTLRQDPFTSPTQIQRSPGSVRRPQMPVPNQSGMIDVGGVMYDPQNVLHDEELQSMGIMSSMKLTREATLVSAARAFTLRK